MTSQPGEVYVAVAVTNGLNRAGRFLDLGMLWVRADCIGTVKPTEEGEAACLVVLTIPGYKTLRVACTADTLLDAIIEAERHTEYVTGVERAKGMRHQ